MSKKPGDEMFIANKKDAEAVDLAKEKERDAARLNNNGMNRDRVDKNAVSDEHNFAEARETLGNRNSVPKTDSEKLAAAAARTGQTPGAAKQNVFADQMHISKKKEEAVDVEKEKERDAARLNNNGMNRDRVDKNAVSDDFDFAAMRAKLGAKNKQAGSASPSAPASEAPSPSPVVQPPTPQQNVAASPVAVSRQPSVASVPRSPQPAAASRAPSRVGTPKENPASPPSVQASGGGGGNAATLSRQGSAHSQQMSASGVGAAPSQQGLAGLASPVAVSRAPSAAGSVAGGSQPAMSRQGSAASRQSLARSHASLVSQPRATATPIEHAIPTPAPATPLESPGSPIDLTGVDWKLTADHLKKQLAKTEKKLDQAESDLKYEKAETSRLTTSVKDLEEKLRDAASHAPKAKRSTGSAAGAATKRELDEATRKVNELTQRLAEKEGALRSAQSQGRASSNASHHPVQDTRATDEMKREVARLRAEASQKDSLIQQLNTQLTASHEAMLAAAQKGFEYDIKLHQARATLVTMVNGSPQRNHSSSPQQQQASPQQVNSPVMQQQQQQRVGSPYSPLPASQGLGYSSPAGHVSPTRSNAIRTPQMRGQLS